MTASARAGVRNLRSGRKKACGAVEQKKAQKQGRKRPQKSGLTVPRSYNPHSIRASNPSPAAPPPHYLPTRFRALALFGRRPPQRVVRSSLPASENLVWGLSVSREKSPRTESFCHVIRLRCGTATLLLGCAERSKPRSRVRRAEGAGLDGECAARVTIIVAATYKPFLVCGFSFHRM